MLSGIFFDKKLFDYITGSGAHVFQNNDNFVEPYFHIDNSLSKKRLFNLIKKLNHQFDVSTRKVYTVLDLIRDSYGIKDSESKVT